MRISITLGLLNNGRPVTQNRQINISNSHPFRSSEEQPMTAATISPWPLVCKNDQHYPVKTWHHLGRLPNLISQE